MDAKLGIRKAGTDGRFKPLRQTDPNAGPVRQEIMNARKYMGPNGELPEFELSLRKPPGADPTSLGYYLIKKFDVELEAVRRDSK
jgi:hypothetical protein